MRHPAIALTIAAAIASSSNAATLEIPFDPQDKGRVFEGIGALSGGASSRLPIDYLYFSGGSLTLDSGTVNISSPGYPVTLTGTLLTNPKLFIQVCAE